MKKTEKRIWILLVFLLIILGLSAFGLLLAFAFWLIGHLPTEQIMEILRHPEADLSKSWQIWVQTGYGWPGFRYLISTLLETPAIFVLVAGTVLAVGATVFLICRFFCRLQSDEKQLVLWLTTSALQTERNLRKHKRSGPLESLPTESSGKGHSLERQFSVLNLETAIQSMQDEELKLVLRWLEKGRQTREQYENVLHQISSKIGSLYYLLDDLTEEMDSAGKNGVKTDLTMAETVLDECSELLKYGLNQSVYQGIHLDQEILLGLNQKKRVLVSKRLNTALDLDAAVIHGDGLWLRQVFETLLANAVECAPAGSQIRISCHIEGDQIRIVYDNALSVEQEALEDETDLQTRRYVSRRQGHYGIGLDLVSKTLLSHQGHFEIRKEGGRFQTVLLLPYSEFDQFSR